MSDETATTDEAGSLGSLLGKIASTRGSPALAAGTLVGGQYEIQSVIGQGGMGVVYLARDRRLDRDVALKIGLAMSEDALAAAEREARVLAKLAHPNVVVAHQVGSIDGRMYIAMEYVDGGTARAWLAAKKRTWREIVALYTAVGDGLAAAHAAGIVHRDFKPENVLVGTDGRPRISDFGVAVLTSDDGPASVAGTIAYMAPEQRDGEAVDSRADQYAFAVALWEALFGTRPDAEPPLPDDTQGVPRAALVALRRALAKDAVRRWPSMVELVRALRRVTEGKRTGIAIGGAVLVAACATAAIMVATRSDDRPTCKNGRALLANAWSAEKRAAFASAPAWFMNAIDDYVGTWGETHDAACKATHVEGTASPALLDRRMFCLDRAKADLVAALDAASASRDALAATPQFLGTPASCLDLSAADDEEPAPKEARAKIDAALAPIAEARASSLDQGKLDPLGKSERAVAAARATNWRPLIARALEQRGLLLAELQRTDEALTVFEEAGHLAIAARADDVAVYAHVGDAFALATKGRVAEADKVIATARALWERMGKPADLGWRLYSAISEISRARGNYQEAAAATREAIVYSRLSSGGDRQLADDHYNLALVHLDLGDMKAAAEANAIAIQLYEKAAGATHPSAGKAHIQAAFIAIRSGRIEDAQREVTSGVGILEDWYGPQDPRLVVGLSLVGDVARLQGKLDEAAAAMKRALGIARANDPTSRQVMDLEQNLAIVALSRGDLVTARTHADAALAAAEKRLGPTHVELLNFLMVVAAVARDQPTPDLAASEATLLRAKAIAHAGLPDGHRSMVNVYIELSYTQVKAGKAADAVAALTPWVERSGTLQLGALTPNELRFALAQAHAATGAKRRACELAASAEEGYTAAKSREAKAVATWRAATCRA